MKRIHYHVFSTKLGFCAIAWSSHGVCSFVLPETAKTIADQEVRKRVAKIFRLRSQKAKDESIIESFEAPSHIQKIVRRVQRHYQGDTQDFSEFVEQFDFTNTTVFFKKVYKKLCHIASGNTTTYGELAKLAGSPKASRAVGQAMASNPIPLLVPCHRVLSNTKSDRLRGFSARGGLKTKSMMLDLEEAKY